jgi:hypothetical protein
MRWRLAGGREPWFDNQVGTLELDGRHARLIIEKTVPNDDDEPLLDTALECCLAD